MKKVSYAVLLLTFMIGAVSGCATAVRYSPDEIKNYPPAIQENIRQGIVTIGMTPQQVRYAWGSPTSLNVLTPTEDGKPKEEWLYTSTIILKRRLLFIDGKVIDILPTPEQTSAPKPDEQKPEQPSAPKTDERK